MVDIAAESKLPALADQNTARPPVAPDILNNTDELNKVIFQNANEVSRAQNVLQDITRQGSMAMQGINEKMRGVLTTKTGEVNQQFNVLQDVISKQSRAASYPGFVVDLLGFFDSDFNMDKQKLRGQAASTELQRINQEVLTANQIRQVEADRINSIIEAAKTGYTSAVTAASATKDAVMTGFAAQDQAQQQLQRKLAGMDEKELQLAAEGKMQNIPSGLAKSELTRRQSGELSVQQQRVNLRNSTEDQAFQERQRAVQTATDEMLTSAITTKDNPMMPAGLAQAELVRRAEQRERLDQLILATKEKKFDFENKVYKDFIGKLNTSEIEHLLELGKSQGNKNFVELKDGVKVKTTDLTARYNEATKQEEEFSSREIEKAGAGAKAAGAQATLELLNKLPGGANVQTNAEVTSLIAKAKAAQSIGNDKEFINSINNLEKTIKTRQEEYLKTLPKEKEKIHRNWIDNGGVVTDLNASTEYVGSVYQVPHAMQGTILDTVWRQFSKEMHDVEHLNYTLSLPDKDAKGKGFEINTRKAPDQHVISTVLRQTDKNGLTLYDRQAGHVMADASLSALEMLAKSETINPEGGPKVNPYSEILLKGNFYSKDPVSGKVNLNLRALVHEFEKKTEEMHQAGLLSANTSLTDNFRRFMYDKKFMDKYDEQYLSRLSPEAQAFNNLIVPGGKPSIAIQNYITRDLVQHQTAVKQILAEQKAQSDQALDMAMQLEARGLNMQFGGKERRGSIKQGMRNPEEIAATVQTIRKENDWEAINNRVRAMLGGP